MERGRSLLADSSPAWWSSSGGGYRRTSQLHEILTNAGIEILPVSRDSACSNLLKYALGFKFLLRTGLSQRCSLRLIRHHGAAVARWEAVFLRHRGGNVVLWEDTHRNNQAIPCIERRKSQRAGWQRKSDSYGRRRLLCAFPGKSNGGWLCMG